MIDEDIIKIIGRIKIFLLAKVVNTKNLGRNPKVGGKPPNLIRFIIVMYLRVWGWCFK